jgi:DNA-directed RNA polymerase specialized sigma24 family protein
LQALLRYLQMCAGSAVTDRVRRQRHEQLLDPLDTSQAESIAAPGEVGPLTDVERARFWAAIRTLLNDEQEEVLVYSYFVLGLKPRQIYERYAQHFASIEDVYRVKRNVLNRLRRSPLLESLWQTPPE